MSIDIRAITAEEILAFRANMRTVFGFDQPEDEREAERYGELMRLERTYGAFDDGELIGTAAAFDFELTIPGATLPMAGLTQVSVRGTHRRRGVMSRMLAAHFADVATRGEALSGLWCSEATIYGRFGYGSVGDSYDLEIDLPRVRIDAQLGGDVTAIVDEDRATELLPALYERVRLARPGMLTRSPAWWKHRRFRELNKNQPKRYVVCRRDGEVTGYAVYRLRAKFEHGLADGTVEIIELFALDARAEASLWHLITSMDLFTKATWWNAPPDTSLPWIVDDPRRVTRLLLDHLWLCITDVPAAMAARRYTCDGAVRFAMRHPDRRETYELVVSDGRGSCRSTTAAAELELDPDALGSIYLGGVSPRILAQARRISGDATAIARFAQLLAWPVAPWCPEVF